MFNIPTIINALSTIATAVDHIQERKRAKAGTEQTEGVAKSLKDLEEADLEHERLIRELSINVEDLAKAVEAEIEKNRERDARNQRLVYVALTLALVALVISVVVLVR